MKFVEADLTNDLGLVQSVPIETPMIEATEEMFYSIFNPMAWRAWYKDGSDVISADGDPNHWNALKRTGIAAIEFVMDNTGRKETLRGKWFGCRYSGIGAEYVAVTEDLPFGEVDRMWGGCVWHKGV